MSMTWIPMAERRPTAQDADAWGCVMVWHIYNGTQMLGWDNPLMGTSKLITHWMSPPAAPEGGERHDPCLMKISAWHMTTVY